MPSHGVSDSVRNHIPTWVDIEVINKIYPEYQKVGGNLGKESFAIYMKNSSSWKRSFRKKHATGFTREYYSDRLGGKNGKVKLLVHSPKSDFSADSYVFTIAGTPVVGGKTKLQSVLYSTAVKDKVKTEVYTKFSPEELQKIETQMQYGDGFQNLEYDRVV